jgi:uncharacterized iron-regulated membrane protein
MIALLAFTGTYFTWRAQYLNFFNAMARTVAPPAPPTLDDDVRLTGTSSVDIDKLITAAQSALPGAQPSIIRFPTRANEPVSIRMRRVGDLRRIGAHTVYLHPSTGAILRVDDFANAPLATRLVDSLAPLHTGEFGNGAIRALWAVAGLALPLLFLTGFLLWWNKSVVRRRAIAPSVADTDLQPEFEKASS